MKLIILVGKPGSGKTHLATTEFKHLTRINQDELGSREECLKALNLALAEGKDIIIDRCNQNVKQRNQWIHIARLYGAKIHCIYLEASNELCIRRISTRENHPTIALNKHLDYYKKIVVRFSNELTVPDLTEDFDSLLYIRVR